jgi:nitrate reductase molybdenum cofactor assembly chaperone NarJ/NarW
MSRRRPAPTLPPGELAVAWQSLSLLLDYPDERLLDRLPLLRDASRQLPAAVGEPIREAVARLGLTPLTELQASYVDTFDSRRRCNLFLTYFAHGDTRKRGVALLRFKQTYLRSGYLLDETELPDHLCVVLEYAATVDQQLGWGLLLDHRAGLELLRLSLRDSGVAWAFLVEALAATLPPLRGDEWDAVRRLAAEGPPEEEVGLDPYAGPSFDPALAARTGAAQDLPMPGFPGGRR